MAAPMESEQEACVCVRYSITCNVITVRYTTQPLHKDSCSNVDMSHHSLNAHTSHVSAMRLFLYGNGLTPYITTYSE